MQAYSYTDSLFRSSYKTFSAPQQTPSWQLSVHVSKGNHYSDLYHHILVFPILNYLFLFLPSVLLNFLFLSFCLLKINLWFNFFSFWASFRGCFRAGFLNFGILTLDQKIPCGCCPMHCRIFNIIAGLYPLDDSSIPSFMIIKDVFRHCQIFLREEGSQNLS